APSSSITARSSAQDLRNPCKPTRKSAASTSATTSSCRPSCFAVPVRLSRAVENHAGILIATGTKSSNAAMYMQQRLGLKLAQKPVLTQSLRQLVKLLALNKLELKEEIQQELLENPVLEIAADNSTRETSLEEAVEIQAEINGAERPSGDSSPDQPELLEGDRAEPGDVFNEIDLGQFFEDYLDP